MVFIIPALIINHGKLEISKLVEFFFYFSPWFLAVLIYENLTALTIHINMPLVDLQLYQADILLFGETPSVFLQNFIDPTLTYVLFTTYVFVYILSPVFLGGYIFLKKGKEKFSEYSHAVVLTMLIGFVVYFIVPGVGPEVYFPDKYTMDVYGDTIIPPDIMRDIQRYPKNAFPSMHTALTTLALLFSFKNDKKAFYLFLIPVLLLWFSTIYLRQHYFVDLLAGWALALLAYKYAPSIHQKAKSLFINYFQNFNSYTIIGTKK
ncbi:phosphatase PAP2 family protein [Candidatus Micrarchaeota archaeon]|nr:phosphatase PAP2 family protein [Candidatus Micrarchaeota archaeon]MBU1166710.1 phosphatase PAP2 family protein [Candidatus Micrarchaeota archaeon]